ncbi:MAG: hypothetical protein ACD_58C00021G0006 [uncultured bacterium]|nr:MAG: hypothetical protein ACD_58C00021G0006 [uncultured bacterium]
MFDPKCFKAYDVRGIYPDQIDDETAYKVGQAYADFVKPQGKIAVGMDVRNSSPALKKNLIQGFVDAGVDVVDIGLVSTEEYYFAVGYYKFSGGIQVTASHNPKEYGGFKMVREDVIPISGDTGLFDIRDKVTAGFKLESDKKGIVEIKDIHDDFARFALTFINASKIKPLKLVYNPNFGFEGYVLKKVVELGKLPLDLVPLNAQPDGNFPKGRPDPFIPENRPEFVELVKSSGADLGVAWDADADRVFFCADGGTFVESYFINSILIGRILDKNPGEKIIYDPRNTWALIDAIKSHGGTPLLERVGHSFIKARMRKDNAIFSGESSGHTYFRDFYYADSGIIPLLLVLEMLSESGKKLSEILEPVFSKYFISGEINFETPNKDKIFGILKQKYADSQFSDLDGISIEYPDWRFNLRGSNTEPKLRLNLEAKSQKIMEEKRDEVNKIIDNNK